MMSQWVKALTVKFDDLNSIPARKKKIFSSGKDGIPPARGTGWCDEATQELISVSKHPDGDAA